MLPASCAGAQASAGRSRRRIEVAGDRGARRGRNAPSSRFSSTVSLGNRRRPSGTSAMPRSTIVLGAAPTSSYLRAVDLGDDAARGRPQHAHHALHQRALAVAVGAEQHHRLGGDDRQRDILQRAHQTVAGVDAVDREAIRQDRLARPRGCAPRPGEAVGDLMPCDQHGEAGREAHHGAHDVLDQDDRDALLVEPEQHREDLLDLGRRQPRHRLVGEQQARLGGDGAGQFELAHLDLGQVARQPACLVASATSRNRSWQRASISARQMGSGAGVDRVHQRHPHIVDQVEGVERLRQLKAAREAEAGALVRDHPVEPLPVEDHAAGLVAQCAAQAVDEGPLAGAVRSDQAEPLAGGDRQLDAVERDKAAEALAEPADLQVFQRRRQLIAGAPSERTSPTMPFGATMTNDQQQADNQEIERPTRSSPSRAAGSCRAGLRRSPARSSWHAADHRHREALTA